MANLVLQRGIKQRVMIGKDGELVLTVLGMRDGVVRLSFDGPESIPIHREEIFKQLQAEGRTHTK